MFSLAHLVKGVGPSDLYLRAKSFLYLPPAYRPEVVITASSIGLKFPGLDSQQTYVDPTDPLITYVAQRYRPLSLLYVLDATTGECENSTFVPSRCEDFATYIPWFFSLLVGDLRFPPKYNPATFQVAYDGVYPYSTNPTLSDFVLDTVCYGSRSRCFTTRVEDILFTEILRELQYFWCYAASRVGNLNNSFIHRSLSEVIQVPAFRCETRFPGSPVLSVPAVVQNPAPLNVRKVAAISYDTSSFVCVNVPAIEPVQLRREEPCACVRVFATPYVRAQLIPVDPVDALPLPQLPPGYTSIKTGSTPISTQDVWSVAVNRSTSGPVLQPEPSLVPWIPNPERSSGPFRIPMPISSIGPIITGDPDARCDYFNCASGVKGYACSNRPTLRMIQRVNPANSSSSFIWTASDHSLSCTNVPNSTFIAVTLGIIRPDGNGGYGLIDSIRSGTPPKLFTRSSTGEPPNTGCFLTTNSLTGTIFKLNVLNKMYSFKVTITAPALCESYTPSNFLETMILQFNEYMNLLGKEYTLGPFSFKSDKGGPCPCP